ncbi:Fic/DOC family protein [Marinobacter lacisalsi]|uniref:Fic/DOC family protein n=1 Tax=Marinobacter lacisalsi TaxID=475979 RepID=A0ABV8QHS1_9GAMM
MTGRYEVNSSEGEYEPGSDGLVLANRLGITSPEDMDELELQLLEALYQAVLIDHFPDRTLTVEDLKSWHRRWMGNVYGWAGEERSVNMSKGDFPFAAAAQIPKLLSGFETSVLARNTPCHDVSEDQLAEAIAETHVEFILIHPFREGNGRLSRLLADVMAVQAGYGTLDYSYWDQSKLEYFQAIQVGMGCDYTPMTRFVRLALASGDSSI